MSEKTQRREVRKDPPENQEDVETTSSIADENFCMSESDVEVIFGEIENRMSKRLRDSQ